MWCGLNVITIAILCAIWVMIMSAGGELDRSSSSSSGGNTSCSLACLVDVCRSVCSHKGSRAQAYEGDLSDDSPVHRPPSPMKIVASAGLVGFSVAQDLLSLDFSTPEEAPEEFRAMPFNRQKSVEIKPGLSGTMLFLCRPGSLPRKN